MFNKFNFLKSWLFISVVMIPFSANGEENTTELNESPERTAKIKQANDLKAEISARYTDLQRERDRQGKISSELLSKSSSGCFANMKMEKLEILVKGGWVDKTFRGKSDNIKTTTGSSTTMTFQLGADIAIVNDEKTQALFQAAGRKVVTDFADRKIGDLEYLKISKGGIGYDSVCASQGTFSGKCYYDVYEKDMYRLDSIEIKVNDQTIYKRALSKAHQFCGDSCVGLQWQEENLKMNEAWLKLMQREDCPQGK